MNPALKGDKTQVRLKKREWWGWINLDSQGFQEWIAVSMVPGKNRWLGGGNSNIFYVDPYLGKISILTNMFQMGWNHHLGGIGDYFYIFLSPNWKYIYTPLIYHF